MLKHCVIALLLLAIAVLSGCSTSHGVCRDIRSLSEFGIGLTQKAVDGQQRGSISFAIREQNRIMQSGIDMQTVLAVR